MKIAVEGCAHGELENIYDTILLLQEKEKITIDLLICCGDFQTSRNEEDLRCMAVPPKYYNICSFYKYYSGEKKAPILTILIGGNHEASNFLQELPYGGWVAPNIYYLGYAGVINIAGLRIGGISGIYKGKDYMKGHHEKAPFGEDTKRSVYHVRNLEIFRLKQISGLVDIFISHDWPANICNYGNKDQLIRFKPHFQDDIESGNLGSKPSEEILNVLKPTYWFAAHLHCKFAAVFPHEGDRTTKFLALDKCLPRRRFLQVLDIAHRTDLDIAINYDLEWLTILLLTNHLLSIKNVTNYMPGPGGKERYDFTPTEDEKSFVSAKFGNNFAIPLSFQETAKAYDPKSTKTQYVKQPAPVQNPQTVSLCRKLGLDDPIELLLKKEGNNSFNHSDASFISNESSNDENSNEDTFIDDTILEASLNSTSSPLKQIRSLSLPQPKNTLTDLEACSDVPDDLCLSEVIDEPEEVILETIERESKDAPSIKKLKRRNVDIYAAEDDT